MPPRSKVTKLRSLIARLESAPRRSAAPFPTGLAALDALLPDGGLAGGSAVEVFSPPGAFGAWRFAAQLLVRAGGGALVELADRGALFPPALARLGLDLRRLLILRPGSRAEALWALEEVARCEAIPLSIAALSGLSAGLVRRLQLGAEDSGALLVLIRPEGEVRRGVGAAQRFRIRPHPAPGRRRAYVLETLRCRGRGPLPPLLVELADDTGAVLTSSLLPH